MADEKIARIKSLKRRHTHVLHYFFRGSDFTVSEICKDFDRNEKTIRGYLTDIYEILGVPDDTNDNEKREWVVREYTDAYEYVFKRGEWDKKHPPKKQEMFIAPPTPKVVTTPETFVPPISVPTRPQATTPPVRETATSINLLPFILLISVVVGIILLINNHPWAAVAIIAPTDTPTLTSTASLTPTPRPTLTPTSTKTPTRVPTKKAKPSPTPTQIPMKYLLHNQSLGWRYELNDSRGPYDYDYLLYDGGTFPYAGGFINTAAWSPDGSWVAFIVDNRLHLVDSEGNNHKILYDLGKGMKVDSLWFDIVWSRDGQKIYFVVKRRSGQYDIYPTINSYSFSNGTIDQLYQSNEDNLTRLFLTDDGNIIIKSLNCPNNLFNVQTGKIENYQGRVSKFYNQGYYPWKEERIGACN